MDKVTIFGSCVSRDLFRLFPNQLTLESYFARSSLVSLMSRATSIKETDIHLNSSFQRRMVMYDFNKEFRMKIQNEKLDYLLIDFIDERCNLLRIENGGFVTLSSELQKSGLVESGRYNFKLHRRVNNERINELWFNACRQFISLLKNNISSEKVILHKAYWATKYKNKENIICEFPEAQMESIRVNNEILERYYSFFEQEFKGIKVIELEKEEYMADESHEWGLSPFHYNYDYYLKVMERLKEIVKS